MDALGTASVSFLNGLMTQLANVGCQGQEAQAGDINFMLAMVEGVGPRDQTEAMLAAQMAAIHNATMTAAQRLAHTETIPQQGCSVDMLNKLGRTFAAQVEALKRYRSSGEQNIKVQHVTVNEGGQAIVGNVQAGGGGHEKGGGQPLEPGGASAGCAPLLATSKRTRILARPQQSEAGECAVATELAAELRGARLTVLTGMAMTRKRQKLVAKIWQSLCGGP